MKYPLIIILLIFFCSNMAIAQDAGDGINIQFTDEQSKPIDGLFVQLMKTSDSSLVLSAFTDSKGSAGFVNVKDGNYFIYVGQFQYEVYQSSSFTKKNNIPVKLGQVTLKTKALKEVTVSAQIPFIQKQPDMTIINVDKSPMNSGGSSMDVLERSPGIIIDQNDNINLQGKSGVAVMIDGKKVVMNGSELADFLRSLPADAIDRIELITNPGVKYDAGGTAGIINIVLKKGKLLGINGTVFGNYSQGIYPKATGGINFNDRTQKFNIFLNYNYTYKKNLKDVTMDQSFNNGNEVVQSDMQHSYYIIPNYINTLHTGVDFFATNKTTLGITADGFIRKYQYDETSNSVMDSAGLPPSYSNSVASDNGTESQYALEFDYKHKYDSLGHKALSGLINYTDYGFNDVQNFLNNYSGLVSSYDQPPVVYGQIPFYTQIYTGQLDYSSMFRDQIKVDAGVKGIYSSITSNNKFFLGTNDAAPIDTAQTQDYQFKETILAGYLAASENLKRGNVSLGLRAEQTDATGNLLTTNQQIKQNYLYFFPHITYADTLNKNNNLGVSAGTRFNRPDYNELDPFKNYISPTAYSEGNPELVPEYEYNVDVSDVFKSIYVFTLSYAFTQHPEETVHIPSTDEPGVTLITDENLQLKNYYGFNVSLSPQITKWWASNTYAAVYYTQYKADVSETPINNGKAIFQGNTDDIFTVTKKLLFEVNGQYSSGSYAGYFQSSQRWLAGAGMQTKLMHGKLLLKLSASDIFYTGNYNTTSTVNNYYESYVVKRDTRVVNITLTYKFGGSYSSDVDKPKKVDNMGDNSLKGL